MTIHASGTLVSSVNIQYLCILIRREVLRQFGMLSAEVEVGGNTPVKLKSIILGWGT